MTCGMCRGDGHVYVKPKYSFGDVPIMERSEGLTGPERQVGVTRTVYETASGYFPCPKCGGSGKVSY
jgi:hypothetical protein